MPVYPYANQLFQQSLVRLDTKNGGLQIASGYMVLDLTTFQSFSGPGDWQRDYIYWDIAIDTLKWKENATSWALLVFPMTLAVSANVNTTQLGWGIDSWGLDPAIANKPDPLGRTNTAGLSATLVLATKPCEVLRVGYQLTLSNPG